MKKMNLFIALGFYCQVITAQEKDLNPLNPQFDRILSNEFKSNEPGATALVSKNGKIIYKKGVGMANLEMNVSMQPDNIFRIGSITKQFTAIAILQLMEQGKLSLQDEITKFIPDYPTQGYQITIENLLTHTSGIPSYTGMKDYMEKMTLDIQPADMIESFKNEKIEFTPGSKWKYSNSGYFLLGYIVEKITGKSYGEYVEEHFFKPLNMTNSFYGSDSKIIKNRAGAYSENETGFENARPLSMTQPFSAGSIQSSAEDLFKWNQAVIGYKLVKKETLTKAFTSYTLSDGKKTDYGYGWRFNNVQDSPTVEHGGAINGFLTMEIYLPEQDVFVTVLSNCDCHSPEDAAAKLAAIAIGKPYEYKELAVDSKMLHDYCGVYENETGEQRILTVTDDKLYSQRGRGPKFNLKSFSEDKFFFEDQMNTIEFTKNEKGEIEKLNMKSRNGNEVWKKTNKPIDVQMEIKLDEKILEAYVGVYEISPQFSFSITKDENRLFLQATGQQKVEIFAESEAKFFLKVNDAELEFIKDDTGKAMKAILNQGGRQTDAKKVL